MSSVAKISLVWSLIIASASVVYARETYAITDIISDIYEQLTETSEVDYEQLQDELLSFADHPIDLNTATAHDLEQLRFLSTRQVDAILRYVDQHPMHNVGELDLISELQPYDIRNLQAFVFVDSLYTAPSEPLYAKEVFHYGRHELLTRLDIRDIESFQSDPVYAQLKYKFNYRNRVQFGLQGRRAPGADWRQLQYGGYVQLNDLGIVQTLVAGNYQAQFGLGLVVSEPFHRGKLAYVTDVGMAPEGLRKYSSVDGQGLHGAGTTLFFSPRVGKNKQHALDIYTSIFYSWTTPNDSLHRHTLGTNIDFRYRRLKVGLTILENLYSDSVTYYAQAKYNQNYFRGQYQTVLGLNFRYNYGWFDVFGEVATAQNQQWGMGAEVGSRFYPVNDVSLVVLYRYYSPTFDNTLGYGFSESSRINDENGLYLGTDIRCVRHWRFSVYGDVFRFSAPKFGIPFAPSLGYDALGDIRYVYQEWNMQLRLRAREKARKGTYSARYQFNWGRDGWRLRTQLDANLVSDSLSHRTWGASVLQDIQYTFAIPLTLQFRVQVFDVRQWDNRIYTYENDVLYANSSPATYGQGGRFYLNLRWLILPSLSLYLKAATTVTLPRSNTQPLNLSFAQPSTSSDIHLLLRANL